MVSFLIAYASWSGNTAEVAYLIEETLENAGIEVELHRIGQHPMPDVTAYEAFLIGSFTWGKGATPPEVKNFVADIGYKPSLTYVFGTGDTQFGGDTLFCAAATKLAKFYESPLEPLRIEQSPRGIQEITVREWTKGVIQHWQHLQELKY